MSLDLAASEFQKQCQTVSANVQKISQNIGNLKRRTEHVLGTAAEDDLHRLLHYTEQLAKDTGLSLRQLKDELLPRLSPADHRQGKLQCERLASDFTAVLSEFQAVQRAVAASEKAKIKRARAETGLAAGYLEEELDQGPLGFQQRQDQVDLQELEEKESALRRLEEDIQDVNQIFKSLATMVHEQGEIVDSIENNVAQASIQVEDAVGQLAHARRSAISFRKKRVYLLITAVVLCVVLGLIIYWSWK